MMFRFPYAEARDFVAGFLGNCFTHCNCKRNVIGWSYNPEKARCFEVSGHGCGLSTFGFNTFEECKAKCGKYTQFKLYVRLHGKLFFFC